MRRYVLSNKGLALMEIITKKSKERQCKANGQVPQLLDSPLPTPRRSCGSSDAPSLRRRSDASPLRSKVPFSWESSPGVPKNIAFSSDREQELLLPKPPPGRWQRRHARSYYGNTSETSSDDTFADALEKVSSPEQLGRMSGQMSSFDGLGSKRFEDAIDRTPSFVTDRFLPAANAIATSQACIKHPKQPPRRTTRCKRDEAAGGATRHTSHCSEHAATPPQSNDATQVQLVPRIGIEAQGDTVSPRACGLMVFFPWSAKPVLFGFRSPERCRTPRAGGNVPPRRSTTLGDALEEEKKSEDDSPRLGREKRSSGKKRGSPGWGMSFFDTSKKYCTDARKALSRLALGGTDSGSPRVIVSRRKI